MKRLIVLLMLAVVPCALGIELKEDTAAQTVLIGPFVDPSTGAFETALVLRDDDIQLSKNGAAFGVKSDTTDPVHMGEGMFSCVLNATDTDTAGRLVINVIDPNVASGAEDPNAIFVQPYYNVVTANWYDSKYGTDELNVDVVQHLGTASATPSTAGYVYAIIKDGTGVGEINTASGGVNLAAGAVTDASLAGGLKIVFETDFGTNYNTTRNGWVTNIQDVIGTPDTVANWWDDIIQATGGSTSINIVNGNVMVDVNAVSGDETAATNAESFFDGTGYAGTNNVIPTVTTVSTVTDLAADAIDTGDISAAAIAEVWANAGADPSALPTATMTMEQKIDWIFASLFAKKIVNATNSEVEIHNFADTSLAEKPFTATDTVYTEENVETPD